MQYNPRDEREIRTNMLLSPGEYDFEVIGAIEKVSKNNNDMIELQVRVFPHDDSSPRLLRDWLVAGSDLGELKINRFAHATGLQDMYFDGSLNSLACEGVAGKLRLTITSSEQWGEQNSIKDYLPLGMGDESSQAPAVEVSDAPAAKAKRAKKANAELQEAVEEDCPF